MVALVGLAHWLRKAPISALGLRLPVLDPISLGILIGGSIGLVLPMLMSALSPKLRTGFQANFASVEAMLPATRAERWWYGAVAVTAGLCEEVLCRGLLIAHFYQGWKGMLGTALLGVGLGFLYIYTGSLLLPMLIHVLIDLRALVLVPAPQAAQSRSL